MNSSRLWARLPVLAKPRSVEVPGCDGAVQHSNECGGGRCGRRDCLSRLRAKANRTATWTCDRYLGDRNLVRLRALHAPGGDVGATALLPGRGGGVWCVGVFHGFNVSKQGTPYRRQCVQRVGLSDARTERVAPVGDTQTAHLAGRAGRVVLGNPVSAPHCGRGGSMGLRRAPPRDANSPHNEHRSRKLRG